ncbi:MAG: response regulator, partial [Desulfobacterales bacterium]|nr:response regulator [Desulfobacterales bacterium]
IEAGKLDLRYSAVSLSALVKEMELLFNPRGREKGLRLSTVLDPDLPGHLILDKIRVRQVCINLLGNAVKFTEKGTIRLQMKGVFPEDAGRSMVDLTIRVEDTGVGISESELGVIFDAFHQVKSQKNGKHAGTGLGLTITRRLVRMMGGDISVTSKKNRGAAFTVLLPGVEVAAGAVISEETERGLSPEAVSFAPGTILIVDDIDYNRELLVTFLENRGFEFVFAENGREAIEQARRCAPDLILLDMKMPVMDGYEASKRLRADDHLKKIPIVAVTASALLHDVEKITGLCDGCLSKPVEKNDLIRALMRFLPHTIVESPPRERANDAASEKESEAGPMKLPPDHALDEMVQLAGVGFFGELGKKLEELVATDGSYTTFYRAIKPFVKVYSSEGVVGYIKRLKEGEIR